MSNFFKNLLGGVVNAGKAVANVLAPTNPWAQGAASGLEGIFSSMQMDDANDRNMQILDKQMDFQREMFDKQVEVNKHSITDQYEQLRDLGINPLGMNLTQGYQSAPSSAPSATPYQYMSPLERAQIDLADSQARKNLAEANAIDPNESKSRTAENQAQARYLESLTTSEDGMRVFKIRDAENNCKLTVEKANLTRAEAKYYRKLSEQLNAQIRFTNAHTKLVTEQEQTEIFNRQQAEIMNKAQRQHWHNEDKAAMVNANANANNVALAWTRWDTEKHLYESQDKYWQTTVENLKKEGRLKDVEVSFAENTLDMRFQAFGAEWLYHITQMEDGTKRIELDLEYLNKHGGMLLKRQYAEDMNAYITGAFTPAFLNAKYGSKVAGIALGGKFLNSASGASTPNFTPPQAPPQNGGFWY